MIKVIRKNGFTIIESVISMILILSFFLILTLTISVGGKVYVQQTVRGNAEAVIETVCDDLKNYIMYGENIQVFYRISDGDKRVAGTDFSGYPAGAEIYWNYKNPGTGIVEQPDGTQAAVTFLEPMDFTGNGVNLGYKKISIIQEDDRIQGLAFGKEYYLNMQLKLEIADCGIRDAGQKGIYEVTVSGRVGHDFYYTTSKSTVSGLNE